MKAIDRIGQWSVRPNLGFWAEAVVWRGRQRRLRAGANVWRLFGQARGAGDGPGDRSEGPLEAKLLFQKRGLAPSALGSWLKPLQWGSHEELTADFWSRRPFLPWGRAV